jgi:hypothetical protein
VRRGNFKFFLNAPENAQENPLRKIRGKISNSFGQNVDSCTDGSMRRRKITRRGFDSYGIFAYRQRGLNFSVVSEEKISPDFEKTTSSCPVGSVKRKIPQKSFRDFSETHFSFPFGGVRRRSHTRRGLTFLPSKQRKKISRI